MSGEIIATGSYHWSEREHVAVENRGGMGFGKAWAYWRDGRNEGEVEAVMIWTASTGLSDCDSRTTSDEQRGRIVRALCETEWGAAALGMEVPQPPDPVTDAFARLRAATAD